MSMIPSAFSSGSNFPESLLRSQIPMSLGDSAGTAGGPIPSPNIGQRSFESPSNSKIIVNQLDSQRQFGISPRGADELQQGKSFSRLGDQTVYLRNGGRQVGGMISPSQSTVLIAP